MTDGSLKPHIVIYGMGQFGKMIAGFAAEKAGQSLPSSTALGRKWVRMCGREPDMAVTWGWAASSDPTVPDLTCSDNLAARSHSETGIVFVYARLR